MKEGVLIAFRGGNVIYPLGKGNWFQPPYFTRVINFWLGLPLLPYIALRHGRFGFYFGAKGFGVDAPAYKNWLPPEEVYPGSLAVMLISIRMTSNLPPVGCEAAE